MLKKLNKNQKGFTLVELIIVIAILGVLSALLVPRIMGNVDKAEANKNKSNARTLASEITNHNALMKVEGATAKVVKGTGANGALQASDLVDGDTVKFTLPAGITLPIAGFDIIIDLDGNASVVATSPTPTT